MGCWEVHNTRALRRAGARCAFLLGTALMVVCFALGFVQSWQDDGGPPELPFDELGQGRAYAVAGDHRAAAQQLRAYALMEPAVGANWTRLANYLWHTAGDQPGAIEAYERALLTFPVPVEAHRALAILYARNGRPDDAHEQALVVTSLGASVPPEVWQAIRRERDR